MEPTKPARHKGGSKITKYLPRATTFTVPTTSGAEASRAPHNSHYHHHRSSSSFSGPISIIPPEARQRRPQGFGGSSTTAPAEPTSPKVSCIGQVKKHKAACRAAKATDAAKKKPAASKGKHVEQEKAAGNNSNSGGGGSKKPPKFVLMRLLRTKSSRSRAEDEKEAAEPAGGGGAAAPPLGQLRRFSSSRNALAGFDWKSGNVAICPVELPVDLESPGMQGHGEEVDYFGLDKDDDCKIPHSAPMVLGGGGAVTEPKKEVNLWKRRTMAPPKPLQLN